MIMKRKGLLHMTKPSSTELICMPAVKILGFLNGECAKSLNDATVITRREVQLIMNCILTLQESIDAQNRSNS